MFTLFDHIPAVCPLCAGRMRGLALCTGCLQDLDHAEGRIEKAPQCARVTGATASTEDGRPPCRCPRCGLPRDSMQAPCWACIATPPPFSRAVVAMPYEPPYDRLIARLKHRHQLWMAGCLARLILRATHGVWQDGSPQLLVPIPASRASLIRRGFNPAGEIARALGRGLRARVDHGVLVRTRDGPKQSELGRLARLVESVDLFAARRPLHGMHVALVDDVMTTGGTLAAAAHALADRGCMHISVLVAARTVR